MKKVLFILTMSISTLLSYAQHSKQRLELGLKGGVNIAKFIQDADNDSRVSFNGGGFAHLHLTKHFAIQPELVYSSQGSKFDLNNIEIETRLGYFNVPVLLQYMTNNGFRLETGPQVGVLVSAKSQIGDTKTDISDNLKDIDFSWAFGASYLTKSRLGINARYNLGLTDINDVANSPSVKNSVIQVGLFYQFKTL